MVGSTAPSNPPIDVLALGIIAVDDLAYVDAYPPPDVKLQVMRRERHLGGLAATALVAAARLGCRCSYAGQLGDDELSRFTIERFTSEGIDLTHLVHDPEASSAYSTIIIGHQRQTRNIFVSLPKINGAHAALPDAAVICQARVLLVDDFSTEGMIRAATIARSANIPVVADLEAGNDPRFQELLGLVDHLILSYDFAARITGETELPVIAERLWTDARQVVVITCGIEGSWYLTRPSRHALQHQPAFIVDTVDTNGCGDVFHGAYAAGLVHGMAVAERLRFASAVAALKTTKPGGQAGIPTLPAVNAFLNERV
ncbi:MAG: hypothetical protein IT324_22665 [Anaerolineae bacterium]|nr:hypothetical protein [Anaerolineae bacterium]